MKSAEFVPKFHTKGKPTGDFYVLSFVDGIYADDKTECVLILHFSPSKDFTKFNFEIRSKPDDRYLAYHRGEDWYDTLEVALLYAYYSYDVPLHLWTLFPKSQFNTKSFRIKDHSNQYSTARKQLCGLFKLVRMWAFCRSAVFVRRFKLKRKVRPLFRFKKRPPVPDPFERNEENIEIAEAAFQMTKKSGLENNLDEYHRSPKESQKLAGH